MDASDSGVHDSKARRGQTQAHIHTHAHVSLLSHTLPAKHESWEKLIRSQVQAGPGCKGMVVISEKRGAGA